MHRHSWRFSFDVGESAPEQLAQRVWDGDAVPESDGLDAAAQFERVVDGQGDGEADGHRCCVWLASLEAAPRTRP
ncbi:hypothetical protein MPC4_250018 [Methylocella tundrae]|uniref:Uncharacterized protein n=1 Tax=Methylocella tundrae TaxID=227605 RepID=A0A8B6M6M8_METTU|nr:hypothetical protein MPC1_290007 [Methylocella tundrae]VTZ50510.1 hypothetical protein MPC4_250018 [Methylocella tundrae]